MAKSPMERTLAMFKDAGYLTAITESYNAHTGQRKDMFGTWDLVAIHPSFGTTFVQVCGADWAPHIEKMTADRREIHILALASGNRSVLVGWRKLKSTGWTPRIREFTLEDFPEVTDKALVSLKSYPDPEWLPRLK